MTLSIKQKAMLIALGTVAAAVTGSIFIAFVVMNVSRDTLAYVCLSAVCGWFVYIFYTITLSRLEYDERSKEMFEKKN
jgi:hypothetical protein